MSVLSATTFSDNCNYDLSFFHIPVVKYFYSSNLRRKLYRIRYTIDLLFVRIFMSMDLIIWYIRILYLFTAYKVLGPKLVMIYEMVSLLCNRITYNSLMILFCRWKMLSWSFSASFLWFSSVFRLLPGLSWQLRHKWYGRIRLMDRSPMLL